MAKIMNINIKEFSERFTEEYNYLYDSDVYVAGSNEAAEAFDELAENHREFVNEFAKYRGDFISSDREAAAFMFALSSFVDQ